MMQLDGSRALAWRLGRHALDPVAGGGIAEIADRVVALRGWPADLADLTVRVRQREPEPGGLERALADGEVIRSYALRGGSYVFTPEVAAALLTIRTTTRVWENARYQRQGGFELGDWGPFRDAVRDLLADGPATRAEIRAHLEGIASLRHLAHGATGAGSDSLYKPLHWWGDICFGPTRDGQATFRLLAGDPRWPGVPDLDEAGRRALALYLGGYGPATPDNLGYWFAEGLSVPRRRLHGWLSDLGEQVREVSVDGMTAYVLASDLDAMSTATRSDVVRLLPGFDPWVLGPGTADARILAPDQRSIGSRGANLVIRGGIVAGSWKTRGTEFTISWFAEAGPPPAAELEAEAARLAELMGRGPDSPRTIVDTVR